MTIAWFEELPSTQDEGHRRAALGAPHGTAIAARRQSAGRGTRGRAWISNEGGLWLSVICRPESGSAVEVIGLRVGLALANYLDGLLPPPARLALKWPNDLMLGEGKVGGVLAEARWQGDNLGWIVVGIGLNLQNRLPAEAEPRAARLLDAGMDLAPADLAGPVASLVADAARVATPLTDGEILAFEGRDWLRQRPVTLPVPGKAEGISRRGLLRIRRSSGDVIEVSGSVALAGAAPQGTSIALGR